MKDKIIFWLDADLTHFGLAKSLQDNYDCELFAILDITDKPKKFFEDQEIIKFQKIWFYHDYILKSDGNPDINYLKSFEEKYRINLWLLAYNERLFYRFNEYYKFNTDEILKILEQECKLFEDILDEIQPNFLLMRATDMHHNHLFYQLCKAKGITCLLLGQSRFAYRSIISPRWHEVDGIENYRKSTGPSRTFEELQEYLKGIDTFKQAKEYTSGFQKSRWSKIRAAYRFLLSNNSNEKTHYTYYGRTKLRVLLKSLTFLMRKKYRELFINRNLIHEINEKEQFLFFPLHVDQESTLLIGGPFHTNQLEVIVHIIKSLPIGYKLYVKEHPIMGIRGWRNVSIYKEIMKLPNVRLIHPSIRPEEIIKKCSLVLSITSTASLEAAFYNKPSIIFADAPYSVLPSVYRIKEIEDLPHVIHESLGKKVDLVDLNHYVNFLHENSFYINMVAFELGYSRYFYYDGNLVDVEIDISKMNRYLEEYKNEFYNLALEHIKKIKQYRENAIKK